MDNIYTCQNSKNVTYINAPSLTAIFNMSLKSRVYIDEWKLARVNE